MGTHDNEARNVAAFRAIVERIINDGEMELCEQFMDPDMVIVRPGFGGVAALLGPGPTPPGDVTAIERFKLGLRGLRAAFPDWRHEIISALAQDDWVAGRWRLTCTHTGDFMGLPPTGKTLNMDEAGFMRFREGRMVEGWFMADELSWVRQLGVECVPPSRNAP